MKGSDKRGGGNAHESPLTIILNERSFSQAHSISFLPLPAFPQLDGALDQTDSLLADWLDPNHLIASVTIIRPSVLLANNSEQVGIDSAVPDHCVQLLLPRTSGRGHFVEMLRGQLIPTAFSSSFLF